MIAFVLCSMAAAAAGSEEPRFGAMAEVGSLRNADPVFDLFSDSNGMVGVGARVAFRPLSRLEVRAGYQHLRRGTTIRPSYGYYDTDYGPAGQVYSAMYVHEVTLGVRTDLVFDDTMLPYLAVDGMLLAALARFDDDDEQRSNVGQVSELGVAPGAGIVAGLELRVPPFEQVQASLNLEVGYTLLTSMDLGTFGSMNAGGLTIRSGLGVRF